MIGTLVSYDSDSLRLRLPTQPQPLALSRVSIERIESERQVARAGSGALIGLGAGIRREIWDPVSR